MESTAPGNEALQLCSASFKVTLFRSKKLHQVLYLEAGKVFVDTLFGFLVMPLGTVLHALSQGVQVKPLNGVSGIFEGVDSSFLLVDPKTLVQPRLAAPARCPCLSDYDDLIIQRVLEGAKISQPPQKRQVLQLEYYKCASQNCRSLSTLKNGRCGIISIVPSLTGSAHSLLRRKILTRSVALRKDLWRGTLPLLSPTNWKSCPPTRQLAFMSLLREYGVASLLDLE